MTRLRILPLLLILAWVGPACSQPPDTPTPSPAGIVENVNWLGYLLYAHQYPGVPEPLYHVDTTIEVGLSQKPAHGVVWRSTAKPPPPAPTQTTCPGLIAIYERWSGGKLASYPWNLPLQPRYVQGLQLCLKPDGTVVWRREAATTIPSNPSPLGLIGSGQASTKEGGAPQMLPWWSYRLEAKDTTQTEGPLIWQAETPTP